MCKLLVDYLFCVKCTDCSVHLAMHAIEDGCIRIIFSAFNKCACPIKCDQSIYTALCFAYKRKNDWFVLDTLIDVHSYILMSMYFNFKWTHFIYWMGATDFLWQKTMFLTRYFKHEMQAKESEKLNPNIYCAAFNGFVFVFV